MKKFIVRPLSNSQGFNMKHMSSEYEVTELSWRNVFNPEHKPTFWGGIEAVSKHAALAGFHYFAWNGWVYETGGDRTDVKTETLG